MKSLAPLCLATLLTASAAFAADPGHAIATGRARIDAKDYAGAIEALQGAIPDATALPNEQQKRDALAAIHFYTALAFSDMEMEAKAREELREFLRFHPAKQVSIDPLKYPAAFVTLVNELTSTMTTNVTEQSDAFDLRYPGYNPYALVAPRETPLKEWKSSPEFILLATPEEQRNWDKQYDDEARRSFIASFWKRRDPDPSTDRNETREEVERRIRFADENFVSESTRGSLSDRGRVFVLLGKPARLTSQPLTRQVGGFATSSARNANPVGNGTYERWVYFKQQLPPTLKNNEIEFRFIDSPGYGSYVLQRDFYTIKAMAEAQKGKR